MIDTISQIGVTILGPLAIFLVSKKNKWGFVVGLASQPFWLITLYLHQQWGPFIVAIIYVGSWGVGVYEWFYKSKQANV